MDIGAASFDEPEPRLAIFGPPAVTRLMFELWQTDRRVRERFDLREPLHRRDYALWLSREGWTLGLNQHSIDAALALARQGTSLVRRPPRWPPQAGRGMTPADGGVDAWLAEPISWDFGAQPYDIPMPRALALLWELRQDVRLHFPNRTPADVLDYFAWCLTQGIRDGCVAVELIGPPLAEFLDTPDPEFDCGAPKDGPPVTRLLRMVAPLYDGPYPDTAKGFPHSRRARLCITIWACGALRRRFGWPNSFVLRPLRWLSNPAAAAADAFLALDKLVVGLWELCRDLQAQCEIATHEGRSALLDWFVKTGARQFELEDCVPASNRPSR